jgi:competence protein ComEC
MRPALLFVIASVFVTPLSAQDSSVRIQVVDVGQGDGILIRTPHRKWVLIDAGTNNTLATNLGPVFGVDRLALVIVSHRHDDHYAGIVAVLNGYPVDRFVGNLADCPDRATDDTIRATLARHGVPQQSVGADTLAVDGVTLIVLPPDPITDPCPSKENDNSILVRLDYGQFSMLFTGDAEVAERTWLMANHSDLLDVDVLKASHHGGNNGILDAEGHATAWLDAVSPRYVVISAGFNRTYKHPMPQAVAAYVARVGTTKVYCTNRHETITIHGRLSGSARVSRKRPNTKSCVYDGTHY